MNAAVTAAPVTPESASGPSMTAYKAREKHWKALNPARVREDPALVDVRALSGDDVSSVPGVRVVGTWTWTNADGSTRTRPVLAFDDDTEDSSEGDNSCHGGFRVIPDAIDTASQLEIAHACLTEYVEAPHVTNMHQQQAQIAGLWRRARESHPSDPSASPLLHKLHWAATGYHYDWTARKYYADKFSPVPPRLAELGARCAEACGMSLRAEAVIVNFYKRTSTMGGHQDDVEYTMDHPVVSLSLGNDCVFLKGGLTKDIAPLEVLLRSGDLAVLGGNSRLAYHGVAKILTTPFTIEDEEIKALIARRSGDATAQAAATEAAKVNQANDGVNANVSTSETTPSPTTESESTDATKDWGAEFSAVRQYLVSHRININIRQVYGPDREEHDYKRQKCQ